MTERQPSQRTRARRDEIPAGMVPLAQRAEELGMTTASLRRYVHLNHVRGDVGRVGNRIFVDEDLQVTAPRARRRLAGASRVPVTGRYAVITRDTQETAVTVELNLDGTGTYQVSTGDPTLEHLLAQIARHGLFDLRVSARGDDLPDNHHLAEDVATVLGRALRQALGEGTGIRRMGFTMVPLDEALAQVAVDVGGRGYAVVDTRLEGSHVGTLSGTLINHLLERFAIEAGVNLHVDVLRGSDAHHKAEAVTKALARSLRIACETDQRATGSVPSTKGTISE